ncbi:hypothetical protein ACFYOC_24460 [Nocardiopsis alba]|uniref:hypothetical protein n=1 Tax=Nocardiopsis alba TaxID=53437 RepID=UPI00368E386F
MTQETPRQRRLRRLADLKETKQLPRVENALRELRGVGADRPEVILLSPEFVISSRNEHGDRPPPPMSRLLHARGIALRFYLLALFVAQCRVGASDHSTNTLPLEGDGNTVGWSDLVAVDVAYNRQTGIYRQSTRQNRTLATGRLRQIKGALDSLEKHGLVEIDRSGRTKNYEKFTLRHEAGRGDYNTPRRYTVPTAGIPIPMDFFLHGWIQVLHSSEIATWLVLRFLRRRFPQEHRKSGVFLYGQTREGVFALKRDAYQNSCRLLRDRDPDRDRNRDRGLGLLTDVTNEVFLTALDESAGGDQPSNEMPLFYSADDDDLVTDLSAAPYKPKRYRINDGPLEGDAAARLTQILQLQEHDS